MAELYDNPPETLRKRVMDGFDAKMKQNGRNDLIRFLLVVLFFLLLFGGAFYL
ncbi:MAG: hypothetical protein K1Y36_06790 [Blastocatellia bacterium]|nr:hypothetical protein [Blastocatellia bacterium]